jgi:uncharacterized membrane protein YeaQ/YmgE (transglycosylase-associated protein family)
MNPVIWCAVGAIVGWLASVAMPVPGLVTRIETVLVGVFGAFIGGEFVAHYVGASTPTSGFTASAFLLAVGGAIALLALLGVMRKAVGPMRPHKRKKARP